MKYEYEIVIRERRENPDYEKQLAEHRERHTRYGVMNSPPGAEPERFTAARCLEMVLTEEEWGAARRAILSVMDPKRDAVANWPEHIGPIR